MALINEPNLADHDTFYQELLEAHAGLTEAEIRAFHARLILILANHVGELGALREALAAARPVKEE